jgi:hypothetical protein
MMPVSLDYPFLNALYVFSNIYIPTSVLIVVSSHTVNNVYTVTVHEDTTINTEVGLTTFIQSLYMRIQQLILR